MSEKMTNLPARIVIIGATSAMAEHCARRWISQHAEGANSPAMDLTLVVRNQSKAESIAADLRVRNPRAKISIVVANFSLASEIDNIVKQIASTGRIDTVLIAHGSLPAQQDCQSDLHLCEETLIINGLSPVLFAEAFVSQLIAANHGTIVIIGSVAGDRGRKSNYVYGAAKGLVSRYAEGLQHRLANSAVKVVLIKPGPTATPMTAKLGLNNLASVEQVAKDIVQAAASGTRVCYTPSKWRLIMLIVRHIPAAIFAKLSI